MPEPAAFVTFPDKASFSLAGSGHQRPGRLQPARTHGLAELRLQRPRIPPAAGWTGTDGGLALPLPVAPGLLSESSQRGCWQRGQAALPALGAGAKLDRAQEPEPEAQPSAACRLSPSPWLWAQVCSGSLWHCATDSSSPRKGSGRKTGPGARARCLCGFPCNRLLLCFRLWGPAGRLLVTSPSPWTGRAMAALARYSPHSWLDEHRSGLGPSSSSQTRQLRKSWESRPGGVLRTLRCLWLQISSQPPPASTSWAGALGDGLSAVLMGVRRCCDLPGGQKGHRHSPSCRGGAGRSEDWLASGTAATAGEAKAVKHAGDKGSATSQALSQLQGRR